ncbi:class I adenylate-forming enzyme family protein [Micromonospora sp. WMMD1082]|uniref:class I adenylate-forming enzyme family protein n=1 Tax=Micromonospora sp. WMMD1082 TaxID=3016104 RepID=UPI002416CBF4|nr:class I adenylate-forming enzyme family protein [Micromonospora sp. WMMD1082]MDG4794548.1 class I adenylate-forming enzyme family protein [Micromonospora sp. WMMD1082]
MTAPVRDVLRAAAQARPDKVAVTDGAGSSYTYAELDRAVAAGARWLRRAVSRPPLLLVPGGGPDDVVAIYAAITAGVVPLIADKTWTSAECRKVASVARAGHALVTTGSALAADAAAASPWPTLRWCALESAGPPAEVDDVAFGRFTSGTTGLPRSLGFTQRASVTAARSWAAASGLTEDDVVLCLATLNNGLAFNTSLLSVFDAGGTLALHPGRPMPSSVARSVQRTRPTVLTAFPYAFDTLVRSRARAMVGLRLAVSSAAPLSAETAQAWRAQIGAPICDYYGLAEVGPVTFNDGAVPGSVGVPLPGVRVAIDAPAGAAEGRVLVRTGSMASRYLDGLAPPLAESLDPEGFLRTRDLGRFDGGRLHLVGRLTGVVNVAGRKIDPTEVAGVLRRLPGVSDVVVRGESTAGGQVLAAYVEAAGLDRRTVVAHCREQLAAYKLPERLVIAGSLPRTSAGKVNAAALSELREGERRG